MCKRGTLLESLPRTLVPPNALPLEEAAETIAELEFRGLQVQPGSRFHQHRITIRNLIENLHSPNPPGIEDLCVAGVAVSEIRELASIVRHLYSSAEWFSEIELAMKGAASPFGESNPLARSRQFELFIASRAAAAGLKPERLEPDVKLTHQGWEVVIAAKRINSPDKLRKRISEAAKQIDKSKLPGMIFLDYSRALFTKPLITMAHGVEQARDHFEVLVSEIAGNAVVEAIESVRSDLVQAVVLFANGVGFDKSTSVLIDLMVRQSFLPPDIGSRRALRLSSLIRVFNRDDASLSCLRSRPQISERLSSLKKNPEWGQR